MGAKKTKVNQDCCFKTINNTNNSNNNTNNNNTNNNNTFTIFKRI